MERTVSTRHCIFGTIRLRRHRLRRYTEPPAQPRGCRSGPGAGRISYSYRIVSLSRCMCRLYAGRRSIRTDNHSQSLYTQLIKVEFRISRYAERTLGQRIRKYRLEKGLKQTDLAKQFRVNEMTIVNWENDKTKPIGRHAKMLMKYLLLTL
jgi:DNA-binding XRE family transcriptional regulator